MDAFADDHGLSIESGTSADLSGPEDSVARIADNGANKEPPKLTLNLDGLKNPNAPLNKPLNSETNPPSGSKKGTVVARIDVSGNAAADKGTLQGDILNTVRVHDGSSGETGTTSDSESGEEIIFSSHVPGFSQSDSGEEGSTGSDDAFTRQFYARQIKPADTGRAGVVHVRPRTYKHPRFGGGAAADFDDDDNGRMARLSTDQHKQLDQMMTDRRGYGRSARGEHRPDYRDFAITTGRPGQLDSNDYDNMERRQQGQRRQRSSQDHHSRDRPYHRHHHHHRHGDGKYMRLWRKAPRNMKEYSWQHRNDSSNESTE